MLRAIFKFLAGQGNLAFYDRLVSYTYNFLPATISPPLNFITGGKTPERGRQFWQEMASNWLAVGIFFGVQSGVRNSLKRAGIKSQPYILLMAGLAAVTARQLYATPKIQQQFIRMFDTITARLGWPRPIPPVNPNLFALQQPTKNQRTLYGIPRVTTTPTKNTTHINPTLTGAAARIGGGGTKIGGR